MTPDMERLCQAACFADGERDWPSAAYEDIVRAVLTALREPSEGMIDATGDDHLWDASTRACIGYRFRDMIDHILGEPATA